MYHIISWMRILEIIILLVYDIIIFLFKNTPQLPGLLAFLKKLKYHMII